MNIFYVIFMFIIYWYFEIYKDKAVSLFEIPKKQDPPTSHPNILNIVLSRMRTEDEWLFKRMSL